MSRLYESFTMGMDDIFGNIPVLDQLSVAGQSLMAAATQQLSVMPAGPSTAAVAAVAATAVGGDAIDTVEAEAELRAFDITSNPTNKNDSSKNSREQVEEEPFVKPICDIFLEVFELNKGNNWLRGRAVVVILHQLLGGAIERKIRDQARLLTQEQMLLKYLDLFRESVWPGGEGGDFQQHQQQQQQPPATTVRTMAEKKRSRTEASLVLATLVPDLAGSVVGRTNAQAASRKIFATLNNPILTYVLSRSLSHISHGMVFPSLLTESG